MKNTVVALTVATTSTLACGSVAQPSPTDALPPKLAGEATELSLSLTPSVRYQFESGIGDAKSSVLRGAVEFGFSAPLGDRLSTAVSLSFEQSRYSWKDFGKVIAGVDRPIRDGLSLTVTPALTYEIDEDWSVIGGAIVNVSAADGAGWGSSATYGGFISARYKLSDSLSLTGGFSLSTQLEDNAQFGPVIGVEWQINEQWRLETAGLGVRGTYKASDELSFIAEVGADGREYRLKDNLPGRLRGGVMRESAGAFSLGVQWKPADGWTIEGVAGLTFAGETRFDDANGNRILKVKSDAAPFIGLTARFEF
jgi:hypothetical protein